MDASDSLLPRGAGLPAAAHSHLEGFQSPFFNWPPGSPPQHLHYEPQQDQMCVVHALNMLLGYQAATPGQMQAFRAHLADELDNDPDNNISALWAVVVFEMWHADDYDTVLPPYAPIHRSAVLHDEEGNFTGDVLSVWLHTHMGMHPCAAPENSITGRQSPAMVSGTLDALSQQYGTSAFLAGVSWPHVRPAPLAGHVVRARLGATGPASSD